MKHDLSFLDSVSVTEVDELLQDIRLLESGAELFYAIDPHEVIDFCFPLSPRQGLPDSERLADDQVALHSVFYLQKANPLLLEEYAYELESTISGIKRSFDKGANIIEALVQGRSLEELLPKGAIEQSSRSLTSSDIFSRHFSLILAVSLGVYAEGFDRYSEIRKHRLTQYTDRNSFLHPEDGDFIQQTLDANRGSNLASRIFRDLMNELEANAPRARIAKMQSHIAKMKQNRLADAFAVARLLQINQILAKAHAQRKTQKPYIFLYLSSSNISSRIFGLDLVSSTMPSINGQRYSILRNRRHFLLDMISAGRDQISNLLRLRELLDKKTKTTAYNNIDRERREDDEDIFLSLALYRENITEHYESIKNYGLASEDSRLRQYSDILQSATASNKYEDYVTFLEEVLTNPDSPDFATMQRNINIHLSEFKTEFRSTLLMTLSRVSDQQDTQTPFLRGGRDPIIGKDQYLPTIIDIEGEPYEAIVDDILSYFRTPPQGPRKGPEQELKTQRIRKACQKFLEIDIGKSTVVYRHELVRCLLFFAVPTPDSDSVAFDHAVELLELIRDTSNPNTLLLEKDFRYLICWAARRKCDYKTANKWATESIEKYKADEDPRFFHARALIIYCWFKDPSARPSGVTMAEAVKCAEEAVRLFEKQYEEQRGDYTDVIASLFNTLACFYCFRLDSSIYDINEARQYLNKLKEVSDKLRWSPNNPEYLHTEAYVEYEEFRCIWKNRDRGGIANAKRRGKKKLQHAHQEIERACKLYQDDEFLSLKIMIETSLAELQEGKEVSIPKPHTHLP